MKSQKFSNLIQLNAESIGIKTLDNEIVDYLNTEVEEKIKLILYQCKKFMRVSKRKTLKVDDLNHSLGFYNFTPLLGYDSYANSEYEKNETIKGLWRQKQNIIDLEEYLSKPISSYPMKPFPHFHWFTIEGKRPNISENFIREEIKDNYLSIKTKRNPLTTSSDNQKIQNHNTGQNITNISNNQTNNSNKNIPVIHNISKELQIFFDNFIQRFRKEIKLNKLISNSQFLSTSKELEVSIEVIRNSPGVVELLPYILEFLMKNIIECSDPKIYMTIIYYLNAIFHNQYFFIEPYLHQIITLLLSMILIDFDNLEYLDNMLKVKILSLKMLRIILNEFKLKYPNLINQLKDVFEQNISNNNGYLSCFGAIEGIIMLGPVFCKKIWTNEKEKLIEIYLDAIIPNKDGVEKIYINDNIENKINIDNDLIHKNDKISNIDEFFLNNIIKKKQMCVYLAYTNIKNIIKLYEAQI